MFHAKLGSDVCLMGHVWSPSTHSWILSIQAETQVIICHLSHTHTHPKSSCLCPSISPRHNHISTGWHPLCRIPLRWIPLRWIPLRRSPFGRIPLCRIPLCRFPLCRFPLCRIPLCRKFIERLGPPPPSFPSQCADTAINRRVPIYPNYSEFGCRCYFKTFFYEYFYDILSNQY